MEKVIYPFREVESEFTMVNNYLFDHIMPIVGPNAWKTLCFIVRKTRGWHKETDRLSFSQLRAGTGISSDATVNKAVIELAAKGYIIVRRTGQWEANEYLLNSEFSTTETVVTPTTETVVDSENATTEIVAVSTTETVDTKERILNKDRVNSANAEFTKPVSCLSLSEIKKTKLVKTEWEQWLEDEKSERGRKTVIGFITRKLTTSPAVRTFHEVTQRWPNKALWLDIDSVVGENLDLWREILKTWISRGYNPVNVNGQLEVFRKGGFDGPNNSNGHSPTGSTGPKLSPEELAEYKRLVQEMEGNH